MTCASLAFMTRRLAEVAKKVGVSEATVSRVLNGKPGVSDATRQAVLTALDVLGYERPTQLRGERARLVGLVLPELQNPIFPAFAEVVGGALAQQGVHPGAVHPDAGRRLRGRLRRPAARSSTSPAWSSPAGCTPRRTPPHDHYQRLAERACRSSWSTRRSRTSASPASACDDARRRSSRPGGHLPSLGHERIGLVLGPPDHMPVARASCGRSQAAAGRPAASSPRSSSSTPCSPWRAASAAAARLIRGRHRHHLRQRPAGARRGAGRPPARPAACPGTCRWSATTTRLHELHRPAADHRAPADRGDGPRGRRRCWSPRSQGGAVPADELLFEPELVVRGSTAQVPR